MQRALVIKITCGVEAPERLNQALTVAATAAAAGVDLSVWLTGEATWMAVPGRAQEFTMPHAAAAADLIEAIRAAGRITVCSQCALRRELTEADLLAGVGIRGAAAYVEEITAVGVQALVY